MKEIVKEKDPHAFVVITDAREISGRRICEKYTMSVKKT